MRISRGLDDVAFGVSFAQAGSLSSLMPSSSSSTSTLFVAAWARTLHFQTVVLLTPDQ
jgi:hypothetical protein